MRQKKKVAELQTLLNSISPPNESWRRFLEELRHIFNSSYSYDGVSVGRFFQIMDYTQLCSVVSYEHNFIGHDWVEGSIRLEKTVSIDLKQPLEPQLEEIAKVMGKLCSMGYSIYRSLPKKTIPPS